VILPTKHISEEYSVLGAGATVLRHLDSPQTVSSLWEFVRNAPGINFYWRFILTLDLLFAIGALDLTEGLIVRNNNK